MFAPQTAPEPEATRQRKPQGEFGRFLETWAEGHGGKVVISDAVAGAGDMVAHICDTRSRADSILKRKGFGKVTKSHYRVPAPDATSSKRYARRARPSTRSTVEWEG